MFEQETFSIFYFLGAVLGKSGLGFRNPEQNGFLITSSPKFEYWQCVVPENIQTPTTEGISLRTPPPPWIFHFYRELMTPHPLGISTSVTKTPQPLWKSSFSRRKTIKVEEWGNLWLVPNGFHQKLVCFCFHLFEWSRNIKTHYTTTK